MPTVAVFDMTGKKTGEMELNAAVFGIEPNMTVVHLSLIHIFYDRMNTVVQENVRGIRVVKTYVREDHETEKFEGVSGMLYRTFSRCV